MINKANDHYLLKFDSIEIPYVVHYKQKKRISFIFIQETLMINAPLDASNKEIQDTLFKKKTLILKYYKLSKGRLLNENELRLHDHRVKVSYEKGPVFSYELSLDSLLIIHPSRMKEEKALQRFKQSYSEEILPEIFEKACIEMKLRPSSLRLKATKSSHGRCNSNGQITLSINLIEYSPAYIRYVCIHELAHLKQMNHSKAFYEVVKTYCPEYKKLIAQVRSAIL